MLTRIILMTCFIIASQQLLHELQDRYDPDRYIQYMESLDNFLIEELKSKIELKNLISDFNVNFLKHRDFLLTWKAQVNIVEKYENDGMKRHFFFGWDNFTRLQNLYYCPMKRYLLYCEFNLVWFDNFCKEYRRDHLVGIEDACGIDYNDYLAIKNGTFRTNTYRVENNKYRPKKRAGSRNPSTVGMVRSSIYFTSKNQRNKSFNKKRTSSYFSGVKRQTSVNTKDRSKSRRDSSLSQNKSRGKSQKRGKKKSMMDIDEYNPYGDEYGLATNYNQKQYQTQAATYNNPVYVNDYKFGGINAMPYGKGENVNIKDFLTKARTSDRKRDRIELSQINLTDMKKHSLLTEPSLQSNTINTSSSKKFIKYNEVSQLGKEFETIDYDNTDQGDFGIYDPFNNSKNIDFKIEGVVNVYTKNASTQADIKPERKKSENKSVQTNTAQIQPIKAIKPVINVDNSQLLNKGTIIGTNIGKNIDSKFGFKSSDHRRTKTMQMINQLNQNDDLINQINKENNQRKQIPKDSNFSNDLLNKTSHLAGLIKKRDTASNYKSFITSEKLKNDKKPESISEPFNRQEQAINSSKFIQSTIHNQIQLPAQNNPKQNVIELIRDQSQRKSGSKPFKMKKSNLKELQQLIQRQKNQDINQILLHKKEPLITKMVLDDDPVNNQYISNQKIEVIPKVNIQFNNFTPEQTNLDSGAISQLSHLSNNGLNKSKSESSSVNTYSSGSSVDRFAGLDGIINSYKKKDTDLHINNREIKNTIKIEDSPGKSNKLSSKDNSPNSSNKRSNTLSISNSEQSFIQDIESNLVESLNNSPSFSQGPINISFEGLENNIFRQKVLQKQINEGKRTRFNEHQDVEEFDNITTETLSVNRNKQKKEPVTSLRKIKLKKKVDSETIRKIVIIELVNCFDCVNYLNNLESFQKLILNIQS